MGMEKAQHTPWEMAWKNMGIMEKTCIVRLRANGKKCFGGGLHIVFIGWSKGFLPMVFYCPWYLSIVF